MTDMGLKVPTTTRFTPGPWEVYREEDEPEAGEEWRMGIRTLDDGEKYLNLVESAYFVIDPNVRKGENEANARLIAAAPELYEALREMHEWRHIRRDFVSQADLEAQRDAMYERARTVLAKVVGE